MKISILMTRIALISLILLFLVSCGNTAKKQTINKVEMTSTKTISQLEANKTDSLTKEYVKLFKKLQSFKSSNDFIKNGLNADSKYKDWFKKVSELSKGSNASLLKKKNLLADNLIELANIYNESKGYETEYSDFITNKITEALKKVEKINN